MSVLFIPSNYWARRIYPLRPGMGIGCTLHAGLQPRLATLSLVQQMQEGP